MPTPNYGFLYVFGGERLVSKGVIVMAAGWGSASVWRLLKKQNN